MQTFMLAVFDDPSQGSQNETGPIDDGYIANAVGSLPGDPFCCAGPEPEDDSGMPCILAVPALSPLQETMTMTMTVTMTMILIMIIISIVSNTRVINILFSTSATFVWPRLCLARPSCSLGSLQVQLTCNDSSRIVHKCIR